jgi:magnesium-transporting ATPase (P-type)
VPPCSGWAATATLSVGLGLVNALISAVQEIRAKRKLDRPQLLDRAPVLVVRDGRDVEVATDEVVRGDVLRVRPGDQIVVDGPLLDGWVEADESLLTGESDPVVKNPDDELRSGTSCVAGGGHQLACDVGPAGYAGRLTAEARRVTTDKTAAAAHRRSEATIGEGGSLPPAADGRRRPMLPLRRCPQTPAGSQGDTRSRSRRSGRLKAPSMTCTAASASRVQA